MKYDIVSYVTKNKNSIIAALFTSFITASVTTSAFWFAFGPPKTYHEMINWEFNITYHIASLFPLFIFLPIIVPMTIPNWIALKIFNVQMQKKAINKGEILFIGSYIVLSVVSIIYGLILISIIDKIHNIISVLSSMIILTFPGVIWGAYYYSYGCKILNTYKKWLAYVIIMLLYIIVVQIIYGVIQYHYYKIEL